MIVDFLVFSAEHARSIEVPGDQTSIVVRNLIPDSEVVNIGVCARNREDQVGPRLVLNGSEAWQHLHVSLAAAMQARQDKISPGGKPVFVQGVKGVFLTLPASKYTKLRKELARATNSAEKLIDSDFFTVIIAKYVLCDL